jgi:serine/threonine protein phosphatase Stp1
VSSGLRSAARRARIAVRRFGRRRSVQRVQINLYSHGQSHVGLVRDVNQDRFLCARSARLWAVADGMGGHENGERAAELVVEHLQAAALPADLAAAREAVAAQLRRANQAILDEAEAAGVTMGSTAAALVIRGRRYAVSWVGDSRVFLVRDGALHQLTTDHSQVQEMVDSGMIGAQEAVGHPMAHVLTRVVGICDEVEVATVDGEYDAGDLFLICSDGLHSYVPAADIAAAIQPSAHLETVERLIASALEQGAPDNVTVVIVRTESVGAAR